MGYRSPSYYSIAVQHGNTNYAAADTKYFLGSGQVAASSEGERKQIIALAGTVETLSITMKTTGNPSTENITIYLRKNGGAGKTLGIINFSGADPILTATFRDINLFYAVGDSIEIRIDIANPFVTPPTTAYLQGNINVRI